VNRVRISVCVRDDHLDVIDEVVRRLEGVGVEVGEVLRPSRHRTGGRNGDDATGHPRPAAAGWSANRPAPSCSRTPSQRAAAAAPAGVPRSPPSLSTRRDRSMNVTPAATKNALIMLSMSS